MEIDDKAGARLQTGGSAIIISSIVGYGIAQHVFPYPLVGVFYILLALWSIGALWIGLGIHLDPKSADLLDSTE